MAIPTVPGSEQNVNTPQQAVHIGAGALAAPARATLSAIDSRYRGVRETLGALEGAGNVLGGLAEDMLKVRDTATAADAGSKMIVAQQSFLESLQGDKDEKGWVERAKTMADEVSTGILSGDVSPRMRRQLQQQLKGWSQSLQIDTATRANLQTINRATLNVQTFYDQAARGGDANLMAAAVAQGRASKLDPVKMDALEQNIPRALAATAIENGLTTNPKGTLDLLKSGASLPIVDQHGKPIEPKKIFSPQELERQITNAHSVADQWQTANFQNMKVNNADDRGNVPNTVIDQNVASGAIKPIDGKTLKISQDRATKLAQKKQDETTSSMIHSETFDALTWEGGIEDADKTHARLISETESIADAKEKAKAISQIDTHYVAAVRHIDNATKNELLSVIRDATAWAGDPDAQLASINTRSLAITDKTLQQEVINAAQKQRQAIAKTGQTAERLVEKEIYAKMRADRANALLLPLTSERPDDPLYPGQLKAGRIVGGMKSLTDPKGPDNPNYLTDEMIKQKFGDKMTRERLIDAELSLAVKNEQKMALFFKEKPDATIDEANAYRKELEKPYVMDRVKQALSPSVSRPAQPPNAAFYSKSTGKWYDKDKKEIP